MTILTNSAPLNIAGSAREPGIIPSGAFKLNRLVSEYDSTTYATASQSSLVDLKIWSNYTGFKAGSKLEIYWHVPCRNDSTSWGGFIMELNISFDGGTTYYSLGGIGFDAVMESGAGSDIHYSNNLLWIDPNQASDYQVRLKFRYCSYDVGTLGVNEGSSSHYINWPISGYNSNYLTTNNSHLRHYMNYSIKEWIQEP